MSDAIDGPEPMGGLGGLDPLAQASVEVLQQMADFGEAAPFTLTARDVKEGWGAPPAQGAGPQRRRPAGGGAPRDRHRRRRVTAVVALAAASIAAVVVPLAALRSRPATTPANTGPSSTFGTGSAPLSDSALTPPRWAPVDYGLLQLSVPGGWMVQDSGYDPCVTSSGGIVWLGGTARPCEAATGNVVWIRQALKVPPAYSAESPITVNGIKVLLGPNGLTATYFVPSLQAAVTLHGPSARRVLATLTRSPLAVVLERAAESRVPASWRRFDFGGVRIAAPLTWSIDRMVVWEPICGFGPPVAQVTLDSGTRPFTGSPACPLRLPTATNEAGSPSLVVATGTYEPSVSAAHGAVPGGRDCMVLHGLEACLSSASFTSTVLSLSLRVPGRATPTVIEVGLAGSGMVAREMVDSIRPASATRD